jgi:hypothetical protein
MAAGGSHTGVARGAKSSHAASAMAIAHAPVFSVAESWLAFSIHFLKGEARLVGFVVPAASLRHSAADALNSREGSFGTSIPSLKVSVLEELVILLGCTATVVCTGVWGAWLAQR